MFQSAANFAIIFQPKYWTISTEKKSISAIYSVFAICANLGDQYGVRIYKLRSIHIHLENMESSRLFLIFPGFF